MTDALLAIFEFLGRALASGLAALMQPQKRIYLPYLVGAFALAVLVWSVRARGRRSLVQFLFPKAIWLHRSALLDYRLVVVRGLLDLAWLGSLSLSSFAVGLSIARLLWQHVAILPRFTVEPWLIVALFSIGAFVAEDLARYALHRLCHRVPALWELHKLHHSAEVLTPLTVYRTHPLEGLLMTAGSALAIGVVTGVCMWAFPGAIRAWEVLGVQALGFFWNVLGANLRHSHVWLSYGARLEHVLISPAQHQIHHSDQARHHDRNFGAALALWDWAFGTLYVTRGRERLRFGLRAGESNYDDGVFSALVGPLWGAVGRLIAPGARAMARSPREA